jgi:hypothetical protein
VLDAGPNPPTRSSGTDDNVTGSEAGIVVSSWSSFSMLSMTPSSSVLSNRDIGEKSEYWCSFRRVQERKNGFVWAWDSRLAWSAAISLSLAPGRYCVSSRTLAKHSAHASRPQSLHIHDDEKIDVIQVSSRWGYQLYHKRDKDKSNGLPQVARTSLSRGLRIISGLRRWSCSSFNVGRSERATVIYKGRL